MQAEKGSRGLRQIHIFHPTIQDFQDDCSGEQVISQSYRALHPMALRRSGLPALKTAYYLPWMRFVLLQQSSVKHIMGGSSCSPPVLFSIILRVFTVYHYQESHCCIIHIIPLPS